jgi:hypothetical protein
VVLPGVVWSAHLGLALDCVKHPTQEERAYDYRKGKQVTQEVWAIHRLPNRVGYRGPTGPEQTNRLDG